MLKLVALAQASAANTAGALRHREDAQTMAEYGVVLSVITIAIITALSLLAGNVRSVIETVAGLVPG